MSLDNSNKPVSDFTLSVNCDEDFFTQVESDLFELMLYRFVDKYLIDSPKWLKPINSFERFIIKYFGIIRFLVLTVCFLSILVSLFGLLFLEPKIAFSFFTFVFMIITVFFWRVRDVKSFRQKYVYPKYYKLYEKIIKIRVNRTLKNGKQALPYKANYQFRADKITAYRIKDNEQTLAFSKTLETFALVNNHVTLFYKCNESMFEKTVIMYDDKDVILPILQQLNIEYEVFYDKQLKELLAKQKRLMLDS